MQVVQDIEGSDDCDPDFDEDVVTDEDDTLADWEVVKYTVPEWALGFLINGKVDFLRDGHPSVIDDDLPTLNKFLEGKSNRDGHWSYDSENNEAYFSWRNDITNLGGNCVDVQWVQRVE